MSREKSAMWVDLRPRRRREQARARRHVRRWITGAACYALFIVIALIVSKVVRATDNRSLQSQIVRAHTTIETEQEALTDVRRDLEESSAILQASLAVGGQPDWGVLLALLSEAAGDDIVLRSCRLEPAVGHSGVAGGRRPAALSVATAGSPPTRLELGGLGLSQADVSQFVLRMDEVPLFEQVKLQDTKREPLFATHAVSFRLECRLAGEEGGEEP